MRARTLVFCILAGMFLPALVFGAGGKEEARDVETLVIYAYDSFVSEWGPGPQVVPLFEEKYGIRVELVSAGDAGQVLSRAVMEKKNPRADLIIGIDNNLLSRALDAEILESYRSPGADMIPRELVFDPGFFLTPFDYGFFSINYDSEKIPNPPRSLEDLTDPRFADSLILMDPRTSSPGLGFLLWTVQVYGDRYLEYWDRLAPSILTITDGWDSGYSLYTSGEAPMVLSYTTSPPVHVEYDNITRFRTAVFAEGNYLQIEGMGILKNAPHREAARKFIDFMLTDPFQEVIPLTNFMYPINKNTPEPESFREYAPKPEKILSLESSFIEQNQEKLVQDWVEFMAARRD